MAFDIGSRIAHYDVTALIGKGGMGQVYQATDTKLNRQVALKILPDAFASDPDRLARFQREAQVLASLNHPNIGQIHGIEETDDTQALVLELIEGPTLADRIAQGPIPVDEALPMAKQIAEALEAAHEAGVIHRDLKPANIKVRDDGTVKVLDFGLAKALDTGPVGDPDQSPTLTAAATQMGVIMGTAAYMSPEQARGKPVDKRADIWAFGTVLYEMLTGKRAFQGDDVSVTLADVIRADVAWDPLPEELSPTLGGYLRRCLEKDPSQRIRDMGDVRLAMEGAFETAVRPAPVLPAKPVPRWQRPATVLPFGILLGALTGFGVWVVQPDLPTPVERFVLPLPASVALNVDGQQPGIAISADGMKVVYHVNGPGSRLYVRRTDDLIPTPVDGSARGFGPFVSPDSSWLGFNDGNDGTLKKVSMQGGPTVTLCSLGAPFMRGASWGEDDRIIFGTNRPSGLWRVPTSGGEPEEVTRPDTVGDNHAWPHVLPGGRAVLFTILAGGSSDNAQIALLDLTTNERRLLVPGGSYPRYSPTGHIVFGVDETLLAVRFDLASLEVTDINPVPVLDGVVSRISGAMDFDIATDGSLVYVAGEATSGAPRSAFWVDHEGNEEVLPLPERSYGGPRLSPDGRRLAVHIVGRENTDVWVSDLARGVPTRLTNDPAYDAGPLWTPDGQHVVYSSTRPDAPGLYSVAADGTDEEQLLAMTNAEGLRPYAWSADSSTLIFDYQTPETGRDIGILELNQGRSWRPLLDEAVDEWSPAISPDGRWIAYASRETGQAEIYAQRYPHLGGKVRISVDFGSTPVWSADGRTLFYSRADSMMAVPIQEVESSLRAGIPEVIFDGEFYDSLVQREFDLSPRDGRFLFLRDANRAIDGNAVEVVLVKNWFSELQRLVPDN